MNPYVSATEIELARTLANQASIALENTVRYPGAPYRFEKTPWQISRRAPQLGEHQAEVFAELEAAL